MDNEQNEKKGRPAQHWSSGWLALGAVGIAVIAFVAGAMTTREVNIRRVANPGGPAMMAKRGMIQRAGRHGYGSRSLGALTAINGNSLTVRISGSDQTVAVSSSTSFYKAGAIAKQSDLQTGDVLRIVGAPDNGGTIQATAVYIQ